MPKTRQDSPRRGRRFFHRIFNRITLTALLLLIQLSWMAAFWIWLSRYAVGISIAFAVLSIVLALYIVLREDNPAYKISWILVLCALPLFGLLIYLVFGDKRLSHRMRRRMEAVEREHPIPQKAPPAESIPPRTRATCRYLATHAGAPAYSDTNVRYFALGDDMFPALLSDIRHAKHYIFLEYFIMAEGKMMNELLDALIERAESGVEVRIIYDDLGSEAATPLSFVSRAQRAGIRTLAFNPIIPILSIVMNHRDHRKFTVIDGQIAYTGGVNIADEYINQKVRFGHWKDTALRLRGAAVESFVYMFLNLWNAFRPSESDYTPYLAHLSPALLGPGAPAAVVPYCDSPLDGEHVGETVYLDILSQAEDYVYIFTPYLIIDSEMTTALCNAAKRGVDVRILTPGIPDKKTAYRLTRSYYPPLLRGGVKIYEYTPGFLHAKGFVSDDRLAALGTINLDYRSLYLHFECGTLLCGGEVIRDIKADFLDTVDKSRPIEPPGKKRHRRVLRDLFDAILRALSPMF